MLRERTLTLHMQRFRKTCSTLRGLQALAEGVGGVPVTVKCRIGVDGVDAYAALHAFVATVAARSPCRHFIVHSRKCLLNGLSPHQNRTVPPLRYGWLFALKRDFPHLAFSINGGLQSAQEAAAVLRHRGPGGEALHGVMIGRAAFHAPWTTLAQADTLLFGAVENGATCRRQVCPCRHAARRRLSAARARLRLCVRCAQVIERYCEYADPMLGHWFVKDDGHKSPSLRVLVKPLLNLFHGERKNKRWKTEIDRVLLEKPPPQSVSEVMRRTLHILDVDVLDAPPEAAEPAQELFAAEATGEWPPVDVPPPPPAAPSTASMQSEASTESEASAL